MTRRICAFPFKGKYYLSQEFEGDLPEQRLNGLTPTISADWKLLAECYFRNVTTLEAFRKAVIHLEKSFRYQHVPLLESSSLPDVEELWMQVGGNLIRCARGRVTVSSLVPFHLGKHESEDGQTEYVAAMDIFLSWSNCDSRVRKAYEFLSMVENQLNYFNDPNNTSRAEGNPEYAHIQGMVTGYLIAKGWEWHEDEEEIHVTNQRRTIFVIQKPKIPQWKKERRQEVAALMGQMEGNV